jgi:uncharacterized membrane protein YkoI
MRGHIVVTIGLGLTISACGSTMSERIATAGLTGAASGGLIGGPVGALVGGGVGGVIGATLDESADVKLNRLARPAMQSVNSMAGAPSGAASGAAERGRPWTSDEVHTKLHDVGYQRVYNIRQQDGAYLARGEREGRAYDIRVDADTGRIISSNDVGAAPPHRTRSGEASSGSAGGISDQQVRDALRQEGYGQVSDLRREGGEYIARAERNGQSYVVHVDARTGRVDRSDPTQ